MAPPSGSGPYGPGTGPYGAPAPGYPAPPPGGSYPAPPPGAGQHPAPSASADPEQQAHLVLDLKHHWLGFMLTMITPMISVNGRLMPGRWGRNMIPVPPGQSHVHIHLPYFLPSRIGPADTTVWLEPGQVVELEYRAPLWAFSAGALGPAPQEWPGKAVMYVLMAFVGLWLVFWLITIFAAIVG